MDPTRDVPGRRPVLDRHRTARPRGGGRVLRRPVRLGVRRRARRRAPAALLRRRAATGSTSPAIGSQPPELAGADAGTPTCGSTAPTTPRRAIEAAGGRLLMGPFDVLDAGRMAAFADPTGAVCFVWEAGRPRAPSSSTRTGAGTSASSTPATAPARCAFYGEVFGWEMSDRAAEDPGMSFWRRPGYGDFLEAADARDARSGWATWERPRGSRTRSPGSSTRRQRRPADAPSHWNVTFGVDDADAIASRAEELGGSGRCWPRSTRRGCG